jgi:hypothetical protein
MKKGGNPSDGLPLFCILAIGNRLPLRNGGGMETYNAFRTEGAAEYCGFKKPTFEKLRLIPDAGPPFCRIGRSIIYLKEDLDRWLKEHRVGSTSQPSAAQPRGRRARKVDRQAKNGAGLERQV